MRTKEDANDYRYFPDPDLLPVRIEQHTVDAIKAAMQAQEDSFSIRRSALQGKVFYVTTLGAADAVCKSYAIDLPFDVYKLQDLHEQAKSIDVAE